MYYSESIRKTVRKKNKTGRKSENGVACPAYSWSDTHQAASVTEQEVPCVTVH